MPTAPAVISTMMDENTKRVPLTLSEDEALVLFEFLSRFSDKEALTIQDQAEERVLWDLCARLERQLGPPLDADYGSSLEKARAAVRDSGRRP